MKTSEGWRPRRVLEALARTGAPAALAAWLDTAAAVKGGTA
ncbi:hypothetical protein ACFXKS_39070 [Streptomyces scopuliridis]